MVSLRHILCALALGVGLVIGLPVLAQSIDVSVSHDLVEPGEIIELEVRVTDVNRARFDMPTGGNFEVLGRSTSTLTSIDGNTRRIEHVATYRIRATREGSANTGLVTARTDRGVLTSPPLVVTVERGAAEAREAQAAAPIRPVRGVDTDQVPAPPASESVAPSAPTVGSSLMFQPRAATLEPGEPFVVARVSEAEPVVGEQVIVDYMLYEPAMSFGLDMVDYTEPSFTDAWFTDISGSRGDPRRRVRTQRVNNETYNVRLLRSFIVVPREAGELVIPEVVLSYTMVGFGRRGAERQQASQPLILDVRDVPDGGPSWAMDNVGRFAFEVEADRVQARVGDTVNLTLSVAGTAAMHRVDLPDVPDIDGLRSFEPVDDRSADVGRLGWLQGRATRRVALVPDREGTFEIPPITFHAFDPFTNRWTQATSEPLSLTVAGVSPHAVDADERDYTAAGAWVDALPDPRPIGQRTVRRTGARLGPVALGLVLLPALAFVGVVGGSAAQRHRQRAAPGRERANAGRTALRALDGLDASDLASASTIATIVRDWLDQIGDTPTRGLRIDALRTHAATLVGDATAHRIAEVVERAEMARYSGSAGEIPALVDEARGAIRAGEEARS